MDIERTSTDDHTATGSGCTYWFTIGGDVFGWVVGQLDGDCGVAPPLWVDVDHVPLPVADEHIAPADQRAAIAMVAS